MTAADARLVDRLVRHEGLRLKPYRDTAGKLTIGVGRNLDAVGLSRSEAMLLLQNDIAAARAALDARWPWWRTLDAARGEVMIELAFNLGPDGLSQFQALLALLRSGASPAAADDLLATRWADEVGARARDLAGMLRTGLST